MRDYPTAPNEFCVNSACNINNVVDPCSVHLLSTNDEGSFEINATNARNLQSSSIKRNLLGNFNTNVIESLNQNETQKNIKQCESENHTFLMANAGNDSLNGRGNDEGPKQQRHVKILTPPAQFGNVRRTFMSSHDDPSNSSGSDFNSFHSVGDDGIKTAPHHISPTFPMPSSTSPTSGAKMNDNRKIVTRFSDEKNSCLLWVITPVAASFSMAIVVAALAGPQWLFTEEKLPNHNYNGTANYNLKDDGAFITKYTKSSLWILCSTLQAMESYSCIKIDYFPKEEYRTDPNDSTSAIPYTIARAAPFFLASGILLSISFLVFVVAMCSNQNAIYYFTSGIIFIVSGLLMLIGLIMYISIFKAEVGSKLRPKSQLQPPLFTFRYGQSFLLYVFGFISTEFVGVLNIFLYINLHQVGNNQSAPCMTLRNFKDLSKGTESSCNSRRILRPYDDEDSDIRSFICKKHSFSNFFYSSDVEKRYFLENPTKCDIHSQNLTKSLNELYTEPAPTFVSTFHLPQEFPLTRSVSTSTEIFSPSSESGKKIFEKKGQKNQSTSIASNEDSYSKDSLHNMCGFSRGILGSAKLHKSKDELFTEFCKKAGVRPRPKNIYFVDDQDHIEPENIFIIDRNYTNGFVQNRRKSLIEPNRRSSNISLHSLDKIYPKSLLELNRLDGPSDLWQNHNAELYAQKNRSSYDLDLYNSRTLPKCFMRRNLNDGAFQSGRTVLQPNFRESLSGFSHSVNNLHKPLENFNKNAAGFIPIKGNLKNNLSVKWPAAIPTSPSNFSTKSLFYPSFQVERTAPTIRYSNELNSKRYYPFDGFDLDQIERERRKSHASLLGMDINYDFINGTAV